MQSKGGELVLIQGYNSCHKVRQLMQNFPAHLPLVAYSSVQQGISTESIEQIKDFFTSAENEVVAPHRADLLAKLEGRVQAAGGRLVVKCPWQRLMFNSHFQVFLLCVNTSGMPQGHRRLILR
jgi:hypothetical protein